jgi:hypothetical protein
VSRWFVQIEARFASVWPFVVEEAVAERLDRAGLLYGDRDNGVQGDPGPVMCASLVIEAADADEAGASGWLAYSEALDAAGAEGYSNERTVTMLMADVERRHAEMEAQVRAWTSGAEVEGDYVVLRDDLGRTDARPGSP